MTTYIETIAARIESGTHHSFLLHGNTRDLQLGAAGSCNLVQHLTEIFSMADQPYLTAIYRVGIGWSFAVESDRAKFAQLTGLAQSAPTNSAFAGLMGSGSSQPTDLPIDVPSAIGLIDQALRQNESRVLCIIDRAELVCPVTTYDRMSPQERATLSLLQAMAADDSITSNGNLLVLITDTIVDLHDSLRLANSRFYAVEITPPARDERLIIAEKVYPQLSAAGVLVNVPQDQFVSVTSMLSRYALMDIFKDSSTRGALDIESIREVKAAALAQEYGEVIESLEPLSNGYESIAGMDKLKSYCNEVIANMRAGNFSDCPVGLLFAGAAGLGKTFFTRALAGQSGLPAINFNIGKLLGSFVGQSERNLERALTAIRSAAPCIVLIDEIESAFPDRATAVSGDSGVSARILKRMLEELSNPNQRGRVLWIGCTNYPRKIDAALARAGRFDVTVAFVPPTESEISGLVTMLGNSLKIVPTSTGLETIAARLVGYTNAEIDSVSRKARQLYASNPQDIDQCWHFAIDRVRSNTRGVQEMTAAALESVNDADLLPDSYIDQWRRLTNQAAPAAPAQTPARNTRPF